MNKHLLDKLSELQMDIVQTKGNTLCTAAPGSGKTRTLVNKILYESDMNSVKEQIAITYTRKASEEIYDRLNLKFDSKPRNIWVGTIHSYCLEKIIRKYSRFSDKLCVPFRIIGEEDCEKLKKKLKEKFFISLYDQVDYTLDEFGDYNEKKHVVLVGEYYEELNKMKKIDFNYVLYETYKMLSENENVTKYIASNISRIYIDEYQDTQDLQYHILKKIYLVNPNISIFIVGDPNQAIYRGIGGICKNINELNKIFNTTFLYKKLDVCYRSHQNIIDFYSQFCIENINIKSKDIRYKTPEVIINQKVSKTGLVDYIASIIIKLKKEGIEENEICIIAPQWTFLYSISNKLREKLPDSKFDAPSVIPLKRDEENVLYKLSKVFLSSYSFTNKKHVDHIISQIKNQFSVEYGLEFNGDKNELLNIILSCKSKSYVGTEFLMECFISFFSKINFLDYMKNDIDDFINGTIERINLYNEYGIEDDRLFFEKSLRSKEGIVITSAHSIKGEEYRAIIAFAMLEGYIPHWNVKFENEQLARDDAKKMLYVICSRAKEKLYLISEKERFTKKKSEYTPTLELLNIK